MKVISDKPVKNIKKELMVRRSIHKKIARIIAGSRVNLLLFTVSVILISLYVVAALLQNTGIFTISASRDNLLSYNLVLSDSIQFDRPQRELKATAVKDMWNITQRDIPKNIDSIDGNHNGKNYMAYTFYLKNEGIDGVKYDSAIDISELHLAVDEAIRIKIYLNGVPNVYAKQKSDGSLQPEPSTIPFGSTSRIIRLNQKDILPGQIDKFTVVAWIEGEDPDCVNSIMGGSIKMVMKFNALMKVIQS